MEITDYITESYNNAESKGWHSKERTFGDMIALCHSELSEALEEYRKGMSPHAIYYVNDKPEGIPIELADVLIRIFDMCGKYQINLEKALKVKMEYNTGRSFRHGDKVL